MNIGILDPSNLVVRAFTEEALIQDLRFQIWIRKATRPLPGSPSQDGGSRRADPDCTGEKRAMYDSTP